MPSLRQKVTTYFRQLSFIAEPRDGPRSPRKTDDDGNFIIKYLEGRMDHIFSPAPEIYNGQNPTDLPELKIGIYPTGPNTITAACTGPDDGLTGIKRSKLHLSASYADDIDFIDTIQESDCYEVRKSINSNNRHNSRYHHNQRGLGARKLSNGSVTTPTGDHNANKVPGMRSRKNSKAGISHLNAKESAATGTTATATATAITAKSSAITSSTTAAVAAATASTNVCDEGNYGTPGKSTTIVVSMVSTSKIVSGSDDQNNKNLLNATKTELSGGGISTKTIAAHTKDTYATPTKVINGTNAACSCDTAIENNIASTDSTTSKLLEHATERLTAVDCNGCNSSTTLLADSIAGVSNWRMESDCAYGIAVSLYENNMLTKEPMGHPIADCYGMVARGDAAVMALADGVNWGDGARLAARSAVHGCLDYLDRAIFGLAQECMASSTQEVFVSLLRSLWEGHGCILEVGGALSTLTIAVVLPLSSTPSSNTEETEPEQQATQRYVVCACNVGDSLGYVYSKKHGVRELTQASHDITSMRDMRDALGALGPADGNKPELSNLTLSMTIVENGDIVFLTSDGISDNFDPVVGKFAEAWTPDVKLMSSSITHGSSQGHGVLAPKRQNKSASAIYARLHRNDAAAQSPQHSAPPVRPARTKKASSPPEMGPASATAAPSRPKYMRSHTVIEPRCLSSGNPATRTHNSAATAVSPKIPKSTAGLPLVTGPQRHALTLHRLEDLLSYGINGTFSPCVSARRLCHLLIDFARMITSARRKTLEQRELFYKLASGPNGIKREVELNRMQHRAARKRIVDSSAFSALPGKLDHATVVAYTVGGRGGGSPADGVSFSPQMAALRSKEFEETNF